MDVENLFVPIMPQTISIAAQAASDPIRTDSAATVRGLCPDRVRDWATGVTGPLVPTLGLLDGPDRPAVSDRSSPSLASSTFLQFGIITC